MASENIQYPQIILIRDYLEEWQTSINRKIGKNILNKTKKKITCTSLKLEMKAPIPSEESSPRVEEDTFDTHDQQRTHVQNI